MLLPCMELSPIGDGERKYSSASSFPSNSGVIGNRVETEDRELESILSLCFSVAPGSVATKLGEDRNDVVFKVERTLNVCTIR